MVVNNTEVIKNRTRINDLLEKLRKKLRSFEVINLKGQSLGHLKDFTLDKSRRLYLVIPQSSTQADSPVYLLSSKYIQQVDASNRVVFVDISLARFHQLPLYQASNDQETEFSQHSQISSLTQSNLSSSGEIGDFDKSKYANQPSVRKEQFEEDNQTTVGSVNTPEIVEEQTVRLLEERLIVNRSKHKVGEIVVRKVIETRIIEVPIQSEKLIVEKVGSESQQPLEVERLPVDEVSYDKVTGFSEDSSTPSLTQEKLTDSGEKLGRLENQSPNQLEDVDNLSIAESSNTSEVVEEEIIALLEERLIINRSKWKVGEVVVRKEIENKIVQVPIRREKLIIEQVSPEPKQIAEIDLGKGENTGVGLTQSLSSDRLSSSVPSADTPYTVSGEFLSPKAASHLLEAIALQKRHGCKRVRVELVLENPELQETYQQMFDRCSSR
ncbi:MAG TPA: DUF2382 domain-containing protein [Coleofasciculaceae cyanobacterium]|jgi:stress response protein YsnF